MREIKFRAYNRNTKNMWWFDLMWGNTDTHGSGWIGMLPIGETREHSGGINGSDNRTQVDPTDCEIMQFTGLKDKNGKEIYEGDIVKIYKYKSDYWDETELIETEHPQQIKMGFNNQYFPRWTLCDLYLKDLQFVGSYDKLEVIGNIYENPELLK